MDDRSDLPKGTSRRELLKLAPVLALGAFAVPQWRESLIGRGLAFSDWAAGKTFRTAHLAPTFGDRDVAPFEAFPYNYHSVLDPEIDLAAWTLDVSGAVAKPGKYTLDQIKALPKRQQNTRHVCVEGWDVIGSFGGTPLGLFLDHIGAAPTAKFVTFYCADFYYESMEIDAARHPQTLLCYEMYGKDLDRGHGAPLRIQMPTKLGYKQPKYLVSLSVEHVLPAERGYWVDQGYSWHGGL